MVLVLNMSDMARRQGIVVDREKLSQALDIVLNLVKTVNTTNLLITEFID